jgi:CheY-like chemotaxis protein
LFRKQAESENEARRRLLPARLFLCVHLARNLRHFPTMKRHRTGHADPLRRVLVVDDDEAFRFQAVAVLRRAGYQVAEAGGALAAMRAVLAGGLDVVVLDLVLPDGHGIEVARAFRAVATTRDICVVAMTGSPADMEFVDPRTFGAETILLKPVTDEALLAAVAHCFGNDQWTGEFEAPVRGGSILEM